MKVVYPQQDQLSEWDYQLVFGTPEEARSATRLAWLLKHPDRISVEVKTKRIPDSRFYIEHTNTTSGEPSGIRATTSDLWWSLIEPVGIAVAFPTPLLRSAILDGIGREIPHRTGRTPTQGRLISLDQLIRWGVGADLGGRSR